MTNKRKNPEGELHFTMPFEPMTIEHLGLRLYSTLPPVISEMATNAYDSESPKVEIQVPSGQSIPSPRSSFVTSTE